MAGPWFTVQKNGDWQRLDTIWMSDGKASRRAHVELCVELEGPSDEAL